MSEFVELPDIQFVETDAATIEAEVISLFESITKRTLNQADPDRIALLAITYILIGKMLEVDRTAKGVLLRYAKNTLLDYMGQMYSIPRTQAKYAKSTERFTLSIPLQNPLLIPQGTRIGPDGGDGSFYFSTEQATIIPALALTADIPVVASEPGVIGNGFLTGQLNKLMDPIQYVSTVSNITTSEGGSEQEDDDTYRERIRTAPEGFATAGPEDAYIYWAKSASPLITDVKVNSPKETPWRVEITALLEGGELPGPEIIGLIEDALTPKTRRPLNDQVFVTAPTKVNFAVNLEYTISQSRITEYQAIQQAVNKAVEDYILWQKTKLGRDINPSELIARVKEAGAHKINVISPATYQEVIDTAVAIAGEPTVTYGGFTND